VSADTPTVAIVGLDFDAAGQLWGIDGGDGREELIKINKTTGATTVIGTSTCSRSRASAASTSARPERSGPSTGRRDHRCC
jgi:hypothetical protein